MKLNYLDFEFIVGESAVQKPQRQLAYFTDGGLDRFFGFEILGKREFWGYCTFHQFIKNNNISAIYHCCGIFWVDILKLEFFGDKI